jgi:hypothetical protein
LERIRLKEKEFREAMMIKTVIRIENDMVLVFDDKGEEMPEYQGDYNYVKDKIIAEAGEGSVYNHWFGHWLKPHTVKPSQF